VELLRKASNMAPAAGEIRLHFAKGLISIGQKDMARKELEALLKTSASSLRDEASALLNSL
jgi:FimV-like protein